jgi:hypothetical protein
VFVETVVGLGMSCAQHLPQEQPRTDDGIAVELPVFECTARQGFGEACQRGRARALCSLHRLSLRIPQHLPMSASAVVAQNVLSERCLAAIQVIDLPTRGVPPEERWLGRQLVLHKVPAIIGAGK